MEKNYFDSERERLNIIEDETNSTTYLKYQLLQNKKYHKEEYAEFLQTVDLNQLQYTTHWFCDACIYKGEKIHVTVEGFYWGEYDQAHVNGKKVRDDVLNARLVKIVELASTIHEMQKDNKQNKKYEHTFNKLRN